MRSTDMRGRRLNDPNLEERLARMPKAEMHFHFEGVFRWSTVWELHPRGNVLLGLVDQVLACDFSGGRVAPVHELNGARRLLEAVQDAAHFG
jgi:hypothetical protein